MNTPHCKTAVAVAMAIAFAASMATAEPLAQGRSAPIVPDATSLLRFYPARLASTPIGVVEDQEVWLAKVQGLMLGAPPMLQQSLLMSQTPGEFAANVALLQQMQATSLAQSSVRLQNQVQKGLLKKQ